MRRWGAVIGVAVALIASCSGRPSPSAAPAPAPALVVASFNFPESHLVAEIYAQALEAAGVPIRRELDLGPRELVLPALAQGFADLVPEYAGTLLGSLSEGDRHLPADLDAVVAQLTGHLRPLGLEVLVPAPAVNQNALVVTSATATRLGLSETSDLLHVAARMTIGGPPECPARWQCLEGLAAVYGIEFGRFFPLSGEAQTRRALLDGVVDVGVMFTTDGSLAGTDLVLLEDDRHLQPPDHLVPVLSTGAPERFGPRVAPVLDAVSARLTTPVLRFLNWRMSVGDGDAAAEARGWLLRQGLIHR